MKLLSVDKAISPDFAENIRLTGNFSRDDGREFSIWFEVPKEIESDVSRSGNFWLLCMLVYAVETGENVELNVPVDSALVENVKGLLMQWKSWYPHVNDVEVIAPVSGFRQDDHRGRRKVAAFFSGGVDSYFTALRNCPELVEDAVGRVDELIYVHGFDIPVSKCDELLKIKRMLESSAKRLGRDLIVVRTNLRQPDSHWASGWGGLSHGVGLAVVGHLLERRYEAILIGSTHPYGQLMPWGSHPISDPLLSSSTLVVRHDGAMFNRVEKTRYLTKHPEIIRNLHVCYQDSSAENCGVCQKCVRTMVTLEVLGFKSELAPFNASFSLDHVGKTFLGNKNDEDFFLEIYNEALEVGNPVFRKVLGRAINKSRIVRRVIPFVDRCRKIPGFWRIGGALRRRLIDS